MWDLCECCRGCKSGILVDRVARKTSCSECGLDLGLGDCGLSIVTTETKNSSDLGYLQSRGSDSLAIANIQNLGADPVSITSMSDSLGLLATVKNKANEIYKEVGNQSRGKDRNAIFAACIYIACRQEDMTRSIRDIWTVANGTTVPNISKTIGVIAETLNIEKNWLMQIKATDVIKRFCSNLGMDSQAVKAAQEAAESSQHVDRSRSPVSVAAAVVYAVAQLHNNKLLPEDIKNATRVATITIVKTYGDLYPDLPTIIPKWFAEAEDLKKLARP